VALLEVPQAVWFVGRVSGDASEAMGAGSKKAMSAAYSFELNSDLVRQLLAELAGKLGSSSPALLRRWMGGSIALTATMGCIRSQSGDQQSLSQVEHLRVENANLGKFAGRDESMTPDEVNLSSPFTAEYPRRPAVTRGAVENIRRGLGPIRAKGVLENAR